MKTKMIISLQDAGAIKFAHAPRTLLIIHSAGCHFCKDLLAELAEHDTIPIPTFLVESRVFAKYDGNLPLSTADGVPQLYIIENNKIKASHTGFLKFAALVDFIQKHP